MTKAELMEYVGKKIYVYFKEGQSGIFGLLGYADDFSEKHNYRKPNYFYIGHTSFKVSHVRKIESEEQMKEKADTPFIEYKNSLGWRGILYGKSSMSICDPGGREIIHTSSRRINTLEELIRYMNCTEFTEFSGQQN